MSSFIDLCSHIKRSYSVVGSHHDGIDFKVNKIQITEKLEEGYDETREVLLT